MTDNARRILRWLISVLCVTAILFMVITVVYASSFSVLVAEDFMHAVKLNVYNDSLLHYIKVCLTYAIGEYLGWQGTYSAMFIQAILSPLNTFGLPMLRFNMILNSVLLFSSVLLLVFTAMRKVSNELIHVKLFIMTLVCFMIVGYEAYTEIFFWFSGAASFSFPLSFMLLGMIFFLLSDGKKGMMCAVLSIVCAFIAMGGTLMVAGMGCPAAMLVYLYRYLDNKKISRRDAVILISWFLFAFMNGIAPGNYKRQAIYIDGGYGISDAIRDTLSIVSDRWTFLLTKTDYVFIICLLVACGMIFGGFMASREIRGHRYRLILGAAGLIIPFCTAFPVAVGYAGLDITNRCEFMVDFAIVISSVFFAVNAGIIIRTGLEKRWKIVFAAVCIAGLMSFILDGFTYRDVKCLAIYSELRSGEYSAYYEGFCDLMEKLDTYEKDTDVVIRSTEFPEDIDNFFAFYIADDPEYWINPYIAKYFGYKSIAVDEE